MKKRNLFGALTICLLAPAASNAQLWEASSTKTFTKDNVAIGIITPPPVPGDPKLKVVLNASGSNLVELWTSSASGAVSVFDNSGWLGIGTIPSVALDVNGDGNIANKLTVGSDASIGGDANISGNGNVTYKLIVGSDGNIGGDCNITKNLTVGIDASIGGNGNVTGNLGVHGGTLHWRRCGD